MNELIEKMIELKEKIKIEILQKEKIYDELLDQIFEEKDE